MLMVLWPLMYELLKVSCLEFKLKVRHQMIDLPSGGGKGGIFSKARVLGRTVVSVSDLNLMQGNSEECLGVEKLIHMHKYHDTKDIDSGCNGGQGYRYICRKLPSQFESLFLSCCRCNKQNDE